MPTVDSPRIKPGEATSEAGDGDLLTARHRPILERMSVGPAKTTRSTGDPSHDFLRFERGALDAIFHPKTVAVVGATDREGSVGRTVLMNLLAALEGRVYAVNPKRKEVLGAPSFPTIGAIPEKVDLAIVVTPA